MNKTLVTFNHTPKKGNCLYKGKPCPTKETYNALGFKGLFQMHTKMQEKNNLYCAIRKNNKEVYGLDSLVNFIDHFSNKYFQVIDKTDPNFDDWIAYYQTKDELQFPEIVDDEEDYYLVREISGEIEDSKQFWQIIHDF